MGKFLEMLLKQYKLPEESITNDMVEYDRIFEDDDILSEDINRARYVGGVDTVVTGPENDPVYLGSFTGMTTHFSGTTMVSEIINRENDGAEKEPSQPKLTLLNKKNK